MINGKAKKQIDLLWDTFYSAGVTNPISIIEQITYLFFMRILEDKASHHFKEGMWHNPYTDKDVPYNSLRWSEFKTLEPKEMLTTINYDVFPFIKNLNDGESAYSRLIGDAELYVQNPDALKRIVEGIDMLDIDSSDAIGEVYEYILDKMATIGKNAQFLTPRHIVRMMVELMQPSENDVICDPSMGSGGFLVESAKYIRDHHKKVKGRNLHGYDIDNTMLRIGAMNMMLHGVDDADISLMDSLSSSYNDSERYTLCFANPPFSGHVDKLGISPSLLSLTNTPRTELLFITLLLRILKDGGRCATIVPDGLLFGKSSAHIALRRELIEHCKLNAVISMPSGVFLPYTGIPTSIIIFTKSPEKTDKVRFYEMRNDGYSMDRKRLEITSNDIPDILSHYHASKGKEELRENANVFLVSVDDIRRKGYSLSFDTYKEVNHEEIKYEATDVIRKRIINLERDIQSAIEELNDRFL